MIVQIDFLKAGNQSLLNTVEAYITNGFYVHLVSSNPANNPICYQYDELPKSIREGLSIYRFKTVASMIRKKSNAAPRQSYNFKERDSTAVIKFLKRRYNLDQLITIISFVIGGLPIIKEIIRKNSIDYIYGYEIYGAILGYILKKYILKSALYIKRFQGTYLFPYLDKRDIFFRLPAHYIAIKCNSDLIVMTNDGTRGNEVIRKLNPNSNYLFLMNGISKDIEKIDIPDRSAIFNRYNRNSASYKFVLLASSRIVNWKRIDRCIDIMNIIVNKMHIEDILLIIAGDGDELDLIEGYANKYRIINNVIFTGSVDHKYLNSLFNIADLILSLYDVSNLSNTVIEALICGKPVLTIDDGSTNYLLKHKYNSILLKLDRMFIQNAAAEIENLYNSPNELNRLKTNAIISSKKILSWESRMRIEIDNVLKLKA